jgi:hypothetical protein
MFQEGRSCSCQPGCGKPHLATALAILAVPLPSWPWRRATAATSGPDPQVVLARPKPVVVRGKLTLTALSWCVIADFLIGREGELSVRRSTARATTSSCGGITVVNQS